MDTTALKMVDQLGLLEDQIDALQEQAEDLKSKIKCSFSIATFYVGLSIFNAH